MNDAILNNLMVFLERVQCTGKECGAWTETYQAVQTALATSQAAAKAAEIAAAVEAAKVPA